VQFNVGVANFPKEKTTRASHRQEESAKARDDSKESVDSFFELQNDNVKLPADAVIFDRHLETRAEKTEKREN